MDKLAKLGNDVAYLWGKYSGSYLSGVWNTLSLAVAATFIGCLIGLACGVLQTIPRAKTDHPVKRVFLNLIHVVLRAYVEVFRGTPMILQAVFIRFALPYFTDNMMRMTVLQTAYLVVSINTGAYMAESVRGGIISIDPGQTEGAKAIGMTHVQTMTSVILPQALRNIMPQIGNNLIINIKDTSVMFIVGYTEFFAAHQAVVGATYKFFPSAVIEMVGYLTMTLVFSFLLRWVERRMDGSGSYELVQTDALTMTAGTYQHPDKGTPFDERSREHEKNLREARWSRNHSARGER
ncbi:MAG: amino acid ABC transporter permease [Clostridiales bacterium]|nr:amino acid ABC transporter permease [Clostridiales bacterium]